MSTWLPVRIALIAGSAISSFVPPLQPQASPPIDWRAVCLIFAFSVIGMLFVIGMQAINSRSSPVWTKPSWYENPFTLKNPLQFFHLAGYAMLASGGVFSARLLISGEPFFPESVVLVAMGAGSLIGVNLCMSVYKFKLAPNNSFKADVPDGPRP